MKRLAPKTESATAMPSERLAYLDGLRGILALIVFIHHFLYAFCPTVIFGGDYKEFMAPETGHWSVNKIIALTPVNIFFNPGTAIVFFFLLSGYVQSYHYLKAENMVILQRSFLKRYFRLAIPTLSVVFLVFVFHRLHLFRKDLIPQNIETSQWAKSMLPDNLNLWGAIRHALVNCFTSNEKYYQVLWTMPIELNNSFLLFIVLLVTHKMHHKPLLFSVAVLAIFLVGNFYGVTFILGAAIRWLEQNSSRFNLIFSTFWVKIVCLLSGLYLASYPYLGYKDGRKPFYEPIAFFEKYPLVICYFIGNSLLFLTLLHSPKIRAHLSKKPLVFFGKLSFMFYIFHFLALFSFSPWLYHRLLDVTSVGFNLLTVFVLSFALIIFASYALYRLVDVPSLNFCNKYVKKIFNA